MCFSLGFCFDLGFACGFGFGFGFDYRARPQLLAFHRLGKAFVVKPAPDDRYTRAVGRKFCSSPRGLTGSSLRGDLFWFGVDLVSALSWISNFILILGFEFGVVCRCCFFR